MKDTRFSLEGYACLENITVRRGETTVRLKVLVPSQEQGKTADEISLDCEVNDDLLPLVESLGENLRKKQEISVFFRAAYTNFSACHSGMNKQDPSNMLIFCAKLLQIDGWYRDGVFEAGLPQSPSRNP